MVEVSARPRASAGDPTAWTRLFIVLTDVEALALLSHLSPDPDPVAQRAVAKIQTALFRAAAGNR